MSGDILCRRLSFLHRVDVTLDPSERQALVSIVGHSGRKARPFEWVLGVQLAHPVIGAAGGLINAPAFVHCGFHGLIVGLSFQGWAVVRQR